MVNYKNKYLEMKLKYINAKNKLSGGASIDNPPRPDTGFDDLNGKINSLLNDVVIPYLNETDSNGNLKTNPDTYVHLNQNPFLNIGYSLSIMEEKQAYHSFLMNEIINGWLLKIPGRQNDENIRKLIKLINTFYIVNEAGDIIDSI